VDKGSRNANSNLPVQNCKLHPLIHTLLNFNLAQDIVVSQLFAGRGNALPQTGHTLFSRLTITVSLHLGHLTGWTFTRLISMPFEKRIMKTVADS